MKYKLIYRDNSILVVTRTNNKLVDILGKYITLSSDFRVKVLFIDKNKMKYWLKLGVLLSDRVRKILNIKNVVNTRS